MVIRPPRPAWLYPKQINEGITIRAVCSTVSEWPMAPMNLTGRPAVALSSELATSPGGVTDPEGTACSASFSRTILPFLMLYV